MPDPNGLRRTVPKKTLPPDSSNSSPISGTIRRTRGNCSTNQGELFDEGRRDRVGYSPLIRRIVPSGSSNSSRWFVE